MKKENRKVSDTWDIPELLNVISGPREIEDDSPPYLFLNTRDFELIEGLNEDKRSKK